MTKQKISFIQFVQLVLGALAAANVEYLIGGAVAGWLGVRRVQHKILLW